ncbi:hypothetical protein [Allokutzneria albata]|uniref:Secreted protein n=1 Tax=Allokutzneria albata TaxID=211114 RepID=A0A1G9RK66_ALLAB|nr:hypothetical protein [Allokutzneria albata]SDM23551.1 hypothetical protein SAMN04489726_0512 [Allokutzneria albata]
MRALSIGTVFAVALCAGPLATPARAERGTVLNCVNYSYSLGNISTTVYYHNHCDYQVRINITYTYGHGSNPKTASCMHPVPKKNKGKVKIPVRVLWIDGDSAVKNCDF